MRIKILESLYHIVFLSNKDEQESAIKKMADIMNFEFNNNYMDVLKENGMIFSGINKDANLVEIIELNNHPHFIACQFHPEFKSRPNRPHPLFDSFIRCSFEYKK